MKTEIIIINSVSRFKGLANSADHRYFSFDFCYNYFNTMRKKAQDDTNIEMSCYVLWSYLASWGMLRGSSYLLQKNPSFLKSLVEVICTTDCQDLFDIDVDQYGCNGVIDKIIKCSKDIAKAISTKDAISTKEHKPSITLVTKIMLGVFACVPAYDSYFKQTFNNLVRDGKIKGEPKDVGGFSTNNLTYKSLNSIFIFYQNNKDVIDKQRPIKVRNFNGENTKFRYSIAKIIDMYGFMASQPDTK